MNAFTIPAVRPAPIYSDPTIEASMTKARAMSQAFDEMADCYGKFDGSFERASARFQAAKEMAS